jgi:hypothetical protein
VSKQPLSRAERYKEKQRIRELRRKYLREVDALSEDERTRMFKQSVFVTPLDEERIAAIQKRLREGLVTPAVEWRAWRDNARRSIQAEQNAETHIARAQMKKLQADKVKNIREQVPPEEREKKPASAEAGDKVSIAGEEFTVKSVEEDHE